MAIFITGTGTNIGKTLFSSMLMAKYARHFGLRYWKPVQTGALNDSDLLKVKKLTGLQDKFFMETDYHFLKPASPHYAGELEFKSVDTIRLAEKFVTQMSEPTIIEGAGGLLVPLNSSTMMVDILKKSRIPVILVSSPELGTINQTLLSIEAMQNRDIPIHGFYMLGEKNELSRNNIFTIQEFSGVKCLGELGIPASIVDGKPFLQYIDTYFDTNESIKNLFK
jgi:dethiobiotin synthetase